MSRNHISKRNPKLWAVLRAKVLKRDKYRCQSCGRAGKLECDHIKPVFQGGSEIDLTNLQMLCFHCHRRKSMIERGLKSEYVDQLQDWAAYRNRLNRRG